MAKKTALHFIDVSKKFIQSIATKQKYRVNETDFTRKRKLNFDSLVLCMIKLLRQNIQIELNAYFGELYNRASKKFSSITSSAFVQSRKKIKPDMFYDLSKILADEFYQDNDENVKLYKGHRLLGIDGSTANLPVNNETKQVYGTFNNQHSTNDVVMARVTIMYDLLNEIVLDGKLCHYNRGEVPLSREHIKLAKENDVIIMDRSYPSFESSYEMQKGNIYFIYRCKINFSNQVNEFYKSKQQQAIIELKSQPNDNGSFKYFSYNKNTTIKVRMIRIELSSGETEPNARSFWLPRKAW
jgi:hypothetical protein